MDTLLEVKNLKKYFATPAGSLHAVDDVSFTVSRKETLGVVGESGCGKSTLGRTILGLLEPTDGQVLFEGRDITRLKGKARKALCSQMQMIFQDPYSSLNPRRSVYESIAQPMVISGAYSKDQIYDRVMELMDVVGLAERCADSYPHELDGGRRQRIGIARALAMDPKFIVCDEPVSSLDVSIQAQILNLLQDLQQANGLAYIFVTHDLSVVKHIADNIIVMYLGCVAERCSSRELFQNPLHPYTKGLLSAIPVPVVPAKKDRIILRGEIKSPIDPPEGCRFAARCIYADERCRKETPQLREVTPGHSVACFYAESIKDEKIKT